MASKKENVDLNQEPSNEENVISHATSLYDDAQAMLKKHKQEVYIFANDMNTWDNNSLYRWSEVAEYINRDPYSVKFGEGNCPKCSAPLSEIEYSSNGISTDIFICQECKTQFDINKNELYGNSQFGEEQSCLANQYVAEVDVLSDDIKAKLESVNPDIIPLITAVKKLNCPMYIHNLEYVDFVYKGKSFLVWLDEENVLHFPNWFRIDKSEFTKEIALSIQKLNHFSLSCTYWLYDSYTMIDKYCFLSSNIDIYSYTNKEIDSTVVQECLDILISEADKNAQLLKHPVIQGATVPKQKIDAIEEIFHSIDCQEICIDEDGDINFIYKGQHMYVKALDENHIRVFWHCMQLETISENENIENDAEEDLLSLFIQWSNVAYPYKCTYYKPTSARHSITTFIDFNIDFITKTEPIYINSKFSKFVYFVDNNMEFTDEDYFLPIQDYYLPIIEQFANFDR